MPRIMGMSSEDGKFGELRAERAMSRARRAQRARRSLADQLADCVARAALSRDRKRSQFQRASRIRWLALGLGLYPGSRAELAARNQMRAGNKINANS